jgi:hypothetical protein
MSGGEGVDTADYEFSRFSVRVSLNGVADDGVPGERDNVLMDVEGVLGGDLADTVIGSPVSNSFDGRQGEDYLDGAGGRDRLVGGSAVDVARSRDGGTPDAVSCGRGPDFAIVDPADEVGEDCEAFDNGLDQVPALGETVVVDPVEGRNRFGPPQMRRSVPLEDRLKLPLESHVDATDGEVRLVSARSRGSRQRGRFYGGEFEVDQGDSGRPFTELRLRGGDFGQCASGARGRRARGGRLVTAARKKRVRRLWGKAKGRYRTRGKNSSASVRGTEFLVEDRCDGTLTKVRRGTVVVRDFGLDRTVVLRAGESYLARAR